MKYIPEIDGLRAVSVLAVLLYHLGFKFIPGGFVGVDVFFVISGFLITSIIRVEIAKQQFSILSFYARRVRRIFPAMIAMLVATLAAGALFLSPGDYEALGKSTAYSAASIGNLFFYLNTGYFDAAAETMPLLHTWSLGVEEQFYIVLPALLIFLIRPSNAWRHAPLIGIAVISVITFALNIWEMADNPKAAFFLTQYRAWELGIGAIIAYIPETLARMPRPVQTVAPLIGAALVLLAMVSFTADATFPGVYAAVPVAGAGLILLHAGRDSYINRILRCRPLPFIGKISYSLYLWHWPVIVYWRHYSNAAELTLDQSIMLGLVSFSLAWASWRWIEQPFRQPRTNKQRTVVSGLAATASVALVGASVALWSGFPSRIPEQISSLNSKADMWAWDCPQKIKNGPAIGLCAGGQDWDMSGSRALVWGDSHAEHFMPILHQAGLVSNTSVALYRACPPIFEENGVRRFLPIDPNYTETCSKSRAAAINLLKNSPDIKTVFIVSAWTGYLNSAYTDPALIGTPDGGRRAIERGLKELFEQIESPGRRIVLVGDVPAFLGDPIPCVIADGGGLLRKKCERTVEYIPRSSFDSLQGPTMDMLHSVARDHPSISLLIPADGLCDSGKCITRVNGEFIYRDGDHIRRNMSTSTYGALASRIGLTSVLYESENATPDPSGN
ncbi:acyltransferase family protein [Alcaligenes aquatilis]|uniref:acyltransferase family protein n=1 Tax=Alcaligenes aquatilis TaxID=323284 RepID=UPI003D24EB93